MKSNETHRNRFESHIQTNFLRHKFKWIPLPKSLHHFYSTASLTYLFIYIDPINWTRYTTSNNTRLNYIWKPQIIELKCYPNQLFWCYLNCWCSYWPGVRARSHSNWPIRLDRERTNTIGPNNEWHHCAASAHSPEHCQFEWWECENDPNNSIPVRWVPICGCHGGISRPGRRDTWAWHRLPVIIINPFIYYITTFIVFIILQN